jgi:N-acetyl-gamma-glutamyl-phosphate reductase
LPELNKTNIKTRNATESWLFWQQQLALLPLAANNLLGSNVHINATTAGAGVSPSERHILVGIQ